jgi:hypothetical protein
MTGEGSKEGIASGATPRRPPVQRSEVRQQQMNPVSQRQLGFLRAPPRSGGDQGGLSGEAFPPEAIWG